MRACACGKLFFKVTYKKKGKKLWAGHGKGKSMLAKRLQIMK